MLVYSCLIDGAGGHLDDSGACAFTSYFVFTRTLSCFFPDELAVFPSLYVELY